MLREASHPSSARAEEVDKFSGGTVGDKNLRHHRPPSSAESTVSDHHLSLCKTWLMYAKPPSELNLDPVTCQVGFAAVLCIMQTTIAAEMRDHDSWRVPAVPSWTVDGADEVWPRRGPRPGGGLHLAIDGRPGRDGGNTALVTTRLRSAVLRRNTDWHPWPLGRTRPSAVSSAKLGSETRV